MDNDKLVSLISYWQQKGKPEMVAALQRQLDQNIAQQQQASMGAKDGSEWVNGIQYKRNNPYEAIDRNNLGDYQMMGIEGGADRAQMAYDYLNGIGDDARAQQIYDLYGDSIYRGNGLKPDDDLNRRKETEYPKFDEEAKQRWDILKGEGPYGKQYPPVEPTTPPPPPPPAEPVQNGLIRKAEAASTVPKKKKSRWEQARDNYYYSGGIDLGAMFPRDQGTLPMEVQFNYEDPRYNELVDSMKPSWSYDTAANRKKKYQELRNEGL